MYSSNIFVCCKIRSQFPGIIISTSCLSLYRVTTINVSRKWIEWAEWAASLCTANSPFPGHVYCSHPVQFKMDTELWRQLKFREKLFLMVPNLEKKQWRGTRAHLSLFCVRWAIRVGCESMPLHSSKVE